MKKLAALAIGLVLTGTALAHEPPRFQRPERSHGVNPWPFIAGAVVGGIIVHEYNTPPNANTLPLTDDPVLVNGVWMQRVKHCTQQIVADRWGNESVVSNCRFVYVPVPSSTIRFPETR